MDSIASRESHVDCPALSEQEKRGWGLGMVVGVRVVGVLVGIFVEGVLVIGEVVGAGKFVGLADGETVGAGGFVGGDATCLH